MVLFYGTEFAAGFVELFIYFCLLKMIFHKQKMCESVIGAVFGAALLVLCSQGAMFSYLTLIVTIAYSCLCGYMIFRDSIPVIFSLECFYIFCLGCLDFFMATLISRLQDSEYILTAILEWGMPRVLFVAAVSAVIVLGYFILKAMLRHLDIHMHNVWGMLVVTAGGFIGFVYLVHQTFLSVSDTTVSAWFFLMVFVGFLFFLCFYISQIREQKQKLDYERMLNSLLEESYQNISDIYDKNAKLYHDLNNHFNVLYQLLNEDTVEDARAYIKEISQPVQMLSRTVWTGVDIVDVVINSKIEKMERKGIPYEINAEYPKDTNIASNDMCTILSNLLDNAIEAAEKLRLFRKDKPAEREEGAQEPVSLTLRRIKGFLMIQITNPCMGVGGKNGMILRTTKEDHEIHGWGLKSVVSVVEKYNGIFNYENENGIFTVTVMIFFEKNNKRNEKCKELS